MPATFNDDECYRLFILVDNRLRALGGDVPMLNELREKLLPFYKVWHEVNPNKVHR